MQSEAGDVEELHDLAGHLPEPERERVQASVAAYVRAVVDEEWSLMGEGRGSARAEALADEIRANLQDSEPSTNAEQALYARGLEAIGDLEASRDARLFYAGEGLPPILWIALAGLAINMMFFSFLVGMENRRLHTLMVAALAAGIVLVLFTVGVLDRPFGTEFRVGPEPFEFVLREIGEAGGR